MNFFGNKTFLIIVALILGVVAGVLLSKIRTESGVSIGEPTSVQVTQEGSKKPFSSKEAEDHFKKGIELFNSKKIEEAIKEFETAARLSPDTPIAVYWIGIAQLSNKEPEKAIARFKRVLEIEPQNYHALGMIGKALSFDKSKVDEATKYLTDALAVNPEFAEARFDLARIYALKGDMNRALGEFSVIFRTEPRYASYHYELGRIFEGMKATDRAKKEYERALQMDPTSKAAKEALQKLK